MHPRSSRRPTTRRRSRKPPPWSCTKRRKTTTAGRTAAFARCAWHCAVGVAVTDAWDCVDVRPAWLGRTLGKHAMRGAYVGTARGWCGRLAPRGCAVAATLASGGHCSNESRCNGCRMTTSVAAAHHCGAIYGVFLVCSLSRKAARARPTYLKDFPLRSARVHRR